MAAQAIDPSEYPTTTLGRLDRPGPIDFAAGTCRGAPGPGHRAKHVAFPPIEVTAGWHLLVQPLSLSADGSISRDTSWDTREYDTVRSGAMHGVKRCDSLVWRDL